MRVNNTGGIPPSDRRIDRRKVAIAAVAALFLFATVPAKAAPTAFTVVTSLSFETTFQSLGGVVFAPQFPGSDTTSLSGTILADIDTPGFIEILSGGAQALGVGAPGIAGVPGDYNPASPPVGAFPGGVTPGANFGTVFSGFGVGTIVAVSSLVHDWGTLAPGPRPIVGTEFDYVPGADFLIALSGIQSSKGTVAALDSFDDLSTDPVAAFGTAGIAKPSWDPLDLTAGPLGTLTLPIESTSTTSVELAPGFFLDLIVSASGVIVATPVPEPSSFALLGVGVVGLLAFGRRIRRRRA